MSLMVNNVQINIAYLTKALNDAGTLGRSTVVPWQAEQRCMRDMLMMNTELQDEDFVRLIKDFTFSTETRIIALAARYIHESLEHFQASGLELEASDGAMPTALIGHKTPAQHRQIRQSVGAIKNPHSTDGNRLVMDRPVHSLQTRRGCWRNFTFGVRIEVS